jgi:hypothetical protein
MSASGRLRSKAVWSAFSLKRAFEVARCIFKLLAQPCIAATAFCAVKRLNQAALYRKLRIEALSQSFHVEKRNLESIYRFREFSSYLLYSIQQ